MMYGTYSPRTHEYIRGKYIRQNNSSELKGRQRNVTGTIVFPPQKSCLQQSYLVNSVILAYDCNCVVAHKLTCQVASDHL